MAAVAFNAKNTKMRYNKLGNSGLVVSELSLGCMTFTSKQVHGDAAYQMMKVAYEHGINFFDNAEAYGTGGESEIIMGKAIQQGVDDGVWEREDLVISTKIFFGGREGRKDSTPNAKGLSRKHLYEGLRRSLSRMQLEYVDLVFAHRPDPTTPIEETVRGMNLLLDKGMAFYWGTSEWSSQQLQEAITVAQQLNMVPPLMDQTQYNMLHRQRIEIEYQPLYPALGTTIWSPLAGGTLTGKFSKDPATWPEEARRARLSKGNQDAVKTLVEHAQIVSKLKPLADDLGCSIAQLAIAWAALNPNVSTVILGATKLPQLIETLQAVDVIEKLTPEVLQSIEVVLANKPVPGFQAAIRYTASKL